MPRLIGTVTVHSAMVALVPSALAAKAALVRAAWTAWTALMVLGALARASWQQSCREATDEGRAPECAGNSRCPCHCCSLASLKCVRLRCVRYRWGAVVGCAGASGPDERGVARRVTPRERADTAAQRARNCNHNSTSDQIPQISQSDSNHAARDLLFARSSDSRPVPGPWSHEVSCAVCDEQRMNHIGITTSGTIGRHINTADP
eukprot:5868570-Prymnesium_polylepis.1